MQICSGKEIFHSLSAKRDKKCIVFNASGLLMNKHQKHNILGIKNH